MLLWPRLVLALVLVCLDIVRRSYNNVQDQSAIPSFRALSSVVNLLASGEAPKFLQPFLAGGVSIALSKSNGGVRPLACGDPFRRLVGKCFCLGAKEDFSAMFAGSNFGVGCPGGVEVVAHTS